MVTNTLGFFIIKITVIVCHHGQVSTSQHFGSAVQKAPKKGKFPLTFVLLDHSVASTRTNGDCIWFATRIEFTV